jgi:hypothetical protein
MLHIVTTFLELAVQFDLDMQENLTFGALT